MDGTSASEASSTAGVSSIEAGELKHHDARLDFSNEMSYGDYLHLNEVLSAQHLLSGDHNEMLFIIQHQTSELWMKLLLHEMNAAIANIARDDLPPAFKMLARVSRIMQQLVAAWDVLATMTPPEYSRVRPYLGPSSGFQSFQYRCIEFACGNKNPAMLRPHAHDPERLRVVQEAFEAPSVYDEAIRLMARQGISVPDEVLHRDVTEKYEANPGVEAAWLRVYQEPERHWALYELGEKLVDLEDAFRLWRFRHVTTVERIIGFKRGTGGTSGIAYLRKMLDVVLFPELWSLRTQL